MRALIPYVLLAVRIFLGVVFILASYHKIYLPKDFSGIVFKWDLLPWYLINLYSLALPWVELVAGVLLIAGWPARGSALVIAALLFMFIAGATINLSRGLTLENCGCFSGKPRPLGPGLIVYDAVLLLGALAIVFGPDTPLRLLGKRRRFAVGPEGRAARAEAG